MVVSTQIKVRPAGLDDRGYIEYIPVRNGFLVADPSEKLPCLDVWETETKQTGCGGLEQRYEAGPVRSVAIEESARGNGYQTRASDEFLARAPSTGISTVYLLTTTADEFFHRLGFEEVAREAVSASIQTASEFSDLWPATAVCMKRNLEESRVVS